MGEQNSRKPAVWPGAWLREHAIAVLALFMAFCSLSVDVLQTRQNAIANRDIAEQQRARLSLALDLEKVDDPAGFRIVAPLQIGGTTDARRVTAKNYVTSGKPKQGNFVSSVNVDWDTREGHSIGDVAPMEVGRRLLAEPLSLEQIQTILTKGESLYFVARLEYCDMQDECHYL